jgi:hypothetical protein
MCPEFSLALSAADLKRDSFILSYACNCKKTIMFFNHQSIRGKETGISVPTYLKTKVL